MPAPGLRVTVLTGAGVSTASGIPDFRGPEGAWTRHPEQADLLEIRRYVADPGARRTGWQWWRANPAWGAQPSAGHRALVDLEGAGRLQAVLTQNFDGLHQAAGSDPDQVVELHGTMRTTSCLACGTRQPTADVLARLDTEPDPPCTVCGGILKPDVVYFGEMLPDRALERAIAAAQDGDVFLAVGTTLSVQPVASLTGLAADSGAEVIIVNAEPTPYDRVADRVVREPIDEALPALVAELLTRD